ncbi:transcription factor S [Candidatus Woesearchaeota archaeon]|nr:transcription factor S [Candidatus Woesearchaeota archaeon]
MMFCPKCGSLLVPKKENKKKILSCSCGYTNKKPKNIELKEVMKKPEKDLEPVDEDVEALPLAEAECPKCQHRKAYFWMVQTRASDEAETKFFKCEKCKHIWRDYD